MDDRKGRRAVIEDSLPEIQQTRADAATAPRPEADEQAALEPAPPQGRDTSRKDRRRRASVFTALKRLWIPLVALAVLAAGGLTVSRLHGIFGSEKSLSYADTKKDEGKSAGGKQMKYEVFGPPGTPAQVSYFGEDGNPQHQDVILPWSLEFPTSDAADIGSVAAQGASSTIGCRITVNGVVKSEKTATHEVSTFVSCLLKAA